MVDLFSLEGLREELAEVLETVGQDGLPGPRDLDVALDAILERVQGKLEAAEARETLSGLKTAIEPAEYPAGAVLKAVVEVMPHKG